MIEHGERITNRGQRERLSKSTFRHLLLYTLINLESNLCEFNETFLTTLQMAIVIHKSTLSLTSTLKTDDHLLGKGEDSQILFKLVNDGLSSCFASAMLR